MESYCTRLICVWLLLSMWSPRDSSILLHKRLFIRFSFLWCSASCECMTTCVSIFLLMWASGGTSIWKFWIKWQWIFMSLVSIGNFSTRHIPRNYNCWVRWWGHAEFLVSTAKEFSKIIILTYHHHLPPTPPPAPGNACKFPGFALSLLWIVIFLHLSQTDCWVMTFNCGVNSHFLRTRKVNYLFECLLVALIFSFVKCLFLSFTHFLVLLDCVFFLLVLEVIYMFCTRVLCQTHISQTFPSTR